MGQQAVVGQPAASVKGKTVDAKLAESLATLVGVLAKLTPWAGGAVVAATCFRIMDEKPSNLLGSLADLLWGWRGRSKHVEARGEE